MEASRAFTKEVLLNLFKKQRGLQQKVTELESRSRRNNFGEYWDLEDSEGRSMFEFMEKLLTTELTIPDGMTL